MARKKTTPSRSTPAAPRRNSKQQQKRRRTTAKRPNARRGGNHSRPSKKSTARTTKPPDAPVMLPLRMPNAELFVSGTFQDGGLMLLCHKRHSRLVSLNQSQFTIIAILILVAKAEEVDAPPAWAPRNFIKTEHLRDEIKRFTGGLVNHLPVARHVYNVRQNLSKTATEHFGVADGHAFAHDLIETNRPEGYRLSVPGNLLHIDVRARTSLTDLL